MRLQTRQSVTSNRLGTKWRLCGALLHPFSFLSLAVFLSLAGAVCGKRRIRTGILIQLLEVVKYKKQIPFTI